MEEQFANKAVRTSVKKAIVASGRTQRFYAGVIGIHPTKLTRMLGGRLRLEMTLARRSLALANSEGETAESMGAEGGAL